MPNLSPFEYQQFLARQLKLGGGDSEAPAGPEAKLHEQIIADCQRRGWYYVHSRMDQPTTQEAGTPDFIIYAENGRNFAVECKARKGKLSATQQAVAAWLHKLGHEWYLVRSFEEYLHLAPCQGRGFFCRLQNTHQNEDCPKQELPTEPRPGEGSQDPLHLSSAPG